MVNNLQTIYADTWEELTLKMLGYHHDHCWHHYSGKCDDLPENLKRIIKFVEEQTGAKVGLVSVGPDREQTIIR